MGALAGTGRAGDYHEMLWLERVLVTIMYAMVGACRAENYRAAVLMSASYGVSLFFAKNI